MTSANIVGYETVAVPSGKYIALSVQFENIGETTAIPIPKLLSGEFSGGKTVDVLTSDQIWRWNTTNNDWEKYFYNVDRKTVIGWCKAGETEVTTDTIEAGETVFFYRGGSTDGSFNLAGGVKSFSAKTSYTTPSGKYVFMGSPWPVAMPIAGFEKNQSNPSGGKTVDVLTADQIWRWNTANNDWDKYFYNVDRKTVIGWCKAGETEVTTDTIPAGEGFFFYRGGSTDDTVTFTYGENAAE